jgi:hypothetical protein
MSLLKKNSVISLEAVLADTRRRYAARKVEGPASDISRQIEALAGAIVDAVNHELLRYFGRC